jgi:hypothetical protein
MAAGFPEPGDLELSAGKGESMKSTKCALLAIALLIAALLTSAQAEVVYTSVNVVIPDNGSYNIDLNRDGITDFTLSPHFLQVYCQAGDGIVWYVAVQPGQSNGSIVSVGQNPVALKSGAAIDSSQIYFGGWELMAEYAYGYCGNFVLGNWLNLLDRYLGFQFQVQGSSGPETHYGWAKVSVTANLDQHNNLQTSTFLSGFAYETIPGKSIAAGQTSEAGSEPGVGTGAAGP